MEAIQETKNQLMHRKEVRFVLDESSNPGVEKVKQHLSQKMKVAADHIAIKSIRNNFGTNSFSVEAFVYDSVELMQKIEPKAKPKKGSGGSA